MDPLFVFYAAYSCTIIVGLVIDNSFWENNDHIKMPQMNYWNEMCVRGDAAIVVIIANSVV